MATLVLPLIILGVLIYHTAIQPCEIYYKHNSRDHKIRNLHYLVFNFA